MLDRFLEAGGTFIDTADVYGDIGAADNSSLGSRASTLRLARRISARFESGCEISSWAGRKAV